MDIKVQLHHTVCILWLYESEKIISGRAQKSKMFCNKAM